MWYYIKQSQNIVSIFNKVNIQCKVVNQISIERQCFFGTEKILSVAQETGVSDTVVFVLLYFYK